MWLPWLLKSPSRVQNPITTTPPSYSLPVSPLFSSTTTPSRLTTTTTTFQFSTFRDVQSLIQDDDDNITKPPHSPLHRTSTHLFNSSSSPSNLLRHRIRACITTALATVRHNKHHQPTTKSVLASPPDGRNRIVVYYTTLHVVRRTYEDCRAVRGILKVFRKIDERDVSMDTSFLSELRGIVGEKWVALPKVFIDGIYIGGMEEIQILHESGELKKLIGRLPALDDDGVEVNGVCCGCGGYRFLVCQECDGSHKVYKEEKTGYSVCGKCDRNGLIRCRSCTSVGF